MFGSSDVARRDEYIQSISAAHWKERLSKEHRWAKVRMKRRKRAVAERVRAGAMTDRTHFHDVARSSSTTNGGGGILLPKLNLYKTRVDRCMYDMARDNADGGRDSRDRYCSRCSKDTYFCRHRQMAAQDRLGLTARRYGSARCTAGDYGFHMRSRHLTNPHFGKRSYCTNFRDHGHIATISSARGLY